MLVKLIEAGISVCLQNTGAVAQMIPNMFAFPVWSEVIDSPKRRIARPGTLIADIGPDAALFNALSSL